MGMTDQLEQAEADMVALGRWIVVRWGEAS
jgi:hypothetical protein